MSTELIKVTINEQELEVEKGARLIDVCRENGFAIPSFCYYQDLALQASCRMCLVRIEKMPKLQTSCTIICTDGMVVTTDSEEVEKAQRSMGEFLLANHPLDCPVCDRGGECELQEVIFDWGDVEERFTERKSPQPEKYLSPIIANDPQRCILCKRCTRVCDEWMGEDAIEAGNRGANTVIGTYGGWLNCSQCGNCIEVCPTGTLLDGVYRHETRTWELDQITSTDVYSSDGMQLSIGSRGGVVHRIVARERYVNGLNGEFLDVKARFAHGFVGHADRIKTPMIRYTKGGKLIPATWDEAVKFAAERFKAAGQSVGVIASPRLTNESVFTLKRFALEAAGSENFAVAEDSKLDSIFDNLSVDLCTHKEIRYAKVIVLIGGEPEEEQTYTAKQIRQAVRNGGAKFICVNDTPINLTRRVTQFVHVNPGTADAFALALADPSTDSLVADKLGIDAGEIVAVRQIINDAQGDVIFMVGNELSAEAQAIIAGTAAKFAGEGRRVLLHPLAKYNNSVGAHDMMPGSRSADQVVSGSKALLIGGSLQSTDGLAGKDFIAVQELFMTETAEFADVVFPAASFAEIDGTFTNNAGNVQRVRKAIEPLHRSKPDWVIASLIAREMGVDFGYDFSASLVFKSLAESVPAYEGLRYPALKDESNPARASYAVAASPDVSGAVTALKARVESMSGDAEKITETPRVGHKLHRLTTMTSKTEQFHLLAHGNPKPGNLLVSPLFQFALDGKPLDEDLADSAEVGAADRSLVGK
ncbi:MAG TPA: molybdopterin-dependent oxidoreductase [Pyrinomonadaceae bacterium]|nr:molybdopterin-dependent oxidoreductase [Chloracidobacterium sp.]MBL0241008.1 molybdopterin-dependent oxidoreductase [Chloracidobacterium sp.]MBP9934732.1 molybdopterin-dependent oxidoreductase [Pyrinomonadaceae bacterium]HQY66379.1 molybdopterin-dependent oxidoreductase [Pyrinomonadaceae bacterium]HRA39429.1 molybdopterin-dependent oxidoreductase [Pyrinomonadaceae bacterium]